MQLSNKEMDLRHQEIMEAFNTLRENTLTCEILTPIPYLGKFGPTPADFALNINFPILVTNDNIDGLVDSIMENEHPRVPYMIHRNLLQKLQQQGNVDREMADPNIYTPIAFNIGKNEDFLKEITRQTEAWDQLEYAARKWKNAYPKKEYNYFDLHKTS